LLEDFEEKNISKAVFEQNKSKKKACQGFSSSVLERPEEKLMVLSLSRGLIIISQIVNYSNTFAHTLQRRKPLIH